MSSSFKSFNVITSKISILLIVVFCFNLSISDNSYASTQKLSKCSLINSIKYDNFNLQLCTKINNKLVWKSQNRPKTLKELNPYTSWYFASKFTKNKTIDKNINFDIIASSNFPEKNKQFIYNSLQKSSIFFNNFVSIDDTVTVIMGTEKDLDFWNNQLNILFNGYYKEIWLSITDSFSRFGSMSNSANAGLASNNKPYILFRYGSSISESDIKNTLLQTTGHEYAHVVQRYFGNIGDIWLSEGTAEFFGLAIETKGASQYYLHRNKKLKNDFFYGSSQQINNKNQLMNKLYGSNYDNSHISFGLIATEAIIAVYGENSLMQFLNKVKNGQQYDAAFLEIFGYNQKDFISEISSYILSTKYQVVAG